MIRQPVATEDSRAFPLRLYKASEVAAMLGCSKERVRELVATGELKSVRLGAQGWHRFRIEDIEHLIAGDS